jgi:predicted MFS family arabinose efflux permease
MLGPVVIVGIGTAYGWREAFWIAGIPGLITAALIWLLVRNPPHERADAAPRGSVIPLLKVRNIRFTLMVATLNMTFFAGLFGFLPLYVVNVLGLSTVMMGAILTALSVAGVIYGFVVPMLSDRFGRKPAIYMAYGTAGLGMVVIAFSGGSIPLVFAGAMLSVAGGAGAGILIMVVIPGESAPPHLKATAMGFNAAVGEMIGAGAMPVVIGAIADRIGLGVLPWILVGVAVLVVLVTLGLRETAPKLVAGEAAAAAAE